MRRRVLVIGHDHVAGLGHLGPALRRRGYATEQVTVVPERRFSAPDVELVLPDVRRYDAIVTLGAPWPRQAIDSWAQTERAHLAVAHDSGVGILGICFGAQLLAEALGGRTEPLEAERVGWSESEPVGWSESEPVESSLPRGPWFQWHADRLVPPPGAACLARSVDGCEAFGVGRSMGVQFHPEMSSDLLRDWLSPPGSDPATARSRQLLAQTEQNERSGLLDRVEALVDLVVDRWTSR